MTPTSLIIVADRGSLKAYRVNETPTRGPSLKLIQAFNVTDAHGKLVDKVTDLAGRYAANDGSELWRLEGLNGEITPSPVYGGGLVIAGVAIVNSRINWFGRSQKVEQHG